MVASAQVCFILLLLYIHTPALQLQCLCPADPQACPALAQQTCDPVVDKTTYCPILDRCLARENTAKLPHLLQISVWMQPAAGTQLSGCDPNLLLTTSCLFLVFFDYLEIFFTGKVGSGATNSSVHS